ncbi:hypothetical protein Acr_05g0012300 [Actinidia rufa]|uniref:DNA/RNA polymerases superfamily protein n=1 Tax=Actinidia rufa TaxID=165716 RepID=A0A7J0EM88_9ERIC|nr:hypothetical protein Acr_05g0012300 [Actinidia rufa]
MPPSRVARRGTTARGGRNARRGRNERANDEGSQRGGNFGNQNDHPPRANTSNCAMEVVREFRKLNPPMFDRVSSDPLVADHWLSEIHKLFDVLDVTEDAMRVKLVACQLSGEANEWWKSVLATRRASRGLARTMGNVNEPNVENMTWVEFEAIFEDQYFLESFKDMLREQFEWLEQGTMTVSEYAMKFQALSCFAPELVSTEEKKCKRNLEVSRVNKKNAKPPTTTVSAPTGSFGVVFGNYGKQNKKRQGEPLQFSRNRSTFRAPTSSGFGGNLSRPPITCHQCGQPGHIRTHCPNPKTLPPPSSRVQGALGACFGCGGFGHIARFCPQQGGTRSESDLVQQSRSSSGSGRPPQRGAHTRSHTIARLLQVRAHRLIEGLVLPCQFRLHRDGFLLSQLLHHHHLLLLRLQSRPLCRVHFYYSTLLLKCCLILEHQRPAGELQPLPVAEWKWKNVMMDFVTGLPQSPRGHDAVWVIVDRLTKTAHFLPIQVIDLIEALSRLYIREIICLHGIPVSIVSDHDPRCTAHFWQGLQSVLGTNLLFSTTYHPQTDGQSERTIQILEDMIRACVLDFWGSWEDHLPLVEFAYNNSYQSSIEMAPYEALGLTRFRRGGKLSPRYIEPFDIIEKIGEVAYCLALPPRLSGIHDVFHVSMLKKYKLDPSHILEWSELELKADASHWEKPIRIIDTREKMLRDKTIRLVRVLWNNFGSEESTWEREDEMSEKHPELFNV